MKDFTKETVTLEIPVLAIMMGVGMALNTEADGAGEIADDARNQMIAQGVDHMNVSIKFDQTMLLTLTVRQIKLLADAFNDVYEKKGDDRDALALFGPYWTDFYKAAKSICDKSLNSMGASNE